jgi:hypothetical protein
MGWRTPLLRSKKKAESRERFWKDVNSFEPTPELLLPLPNTGSDVQAEKEILERLAGLIIDW